MECLYTVEQGLKKGNLNQYSQLVARSEYIGLAGSIRNDRRAGRRRAGRRRRLEKDMPDQLVTINKIVVSGNALYRVLPVVYLQRVFGSGDVFGSDRRHCKHIVCAQ